MLQWKLKESWVAQMDRVESLVELERALGTRRGSLIALVPTMGALHAGHEALIEKAKSLAQTTVLSIFVNPLQFGDSTDFARYPRTLAADIDAARRLGVDVIWIPTEEDVYPSGMKITLVDPGPLGNEFEGAIRPGHFAGVLTVVSRLFDGVRPQFAIFGEKDRQQLELVKRMVKPEGCIEIVGVPTIREGDGLALSSRNQFLNDLERERALGMYRAINHAQQVGVDGVATVAAVVAQELNALDVEYSHLVDAQTWEVVSNGFSGEAILVIAAKVGSVHLIDNGLVRIG
jgi:pantoate--beta-alanine ligase